MQYFNNCWRNYDGKIEVFKKKPYREGSKSSRYGGIPPLLATLLLTDVDIENCIVDSSFELMKRIIIRTHNISSITKNIIINTVDKIKGHFNTNNAKS